MLYIFVSSLAWQLFVNKAKLIFICTGTMSFKEQLLQGDWLKELLLILLLKMWFVSAQTNQNAVEWKLNTSHFHGFMGKPTFLKQSGIFVHNIHDNSTSLSINPRLADWMSLTGKMAKISTGSLEKHFFGGAGIAFD